MSHKTLRTRIAAAMLVLFFVATSMPETVLAINTNIPDLLVNTESFQTIDPGDGTSVIDLRFGETLNARLYYDTSATRFNFTKDVWVQGALTATGALTTKKTLSGNTLVISRNASISGALVVVGNTTVRGTLSGTTINANSLLTGSTLQGFGLFNCQGSSNKLTYDATTKKFLCETDQTGGAGSAPEVGTAAFSGATLRLGDARYVKKQGDTMTGALTINLSSGFLGLKIIQMASGSVIHAERTLTSSGMLKVQQTEIQGSGALVVDQVRNSTGAYIRGSGSHIRQPLLALDSSTGSTHAPHLLFGYLGRFDVNLYRATGGVLRTNGSFIATGSVSGAYLTFMGAQSSYVLGSLGIGKANPSTKLEVVGTISGSFIRASNLTVSGAVLYSSGNLIKQNAKGASGQLLISQGTSAPVWKDQKTSLVWYLDSTIATGTNQSAIVTMPFGLVASSGSLRIKGAPTGSALTVDIRKDGTSIYSTKPSIPAGAITAKNGVFSTTNLTEGSEISLSVTQVGSTFAGSGLTIMLTGNRKY